MSQAIYINNKKFSLSPKDSIGKGGEADIYSLGNGEAVKIYKTEKHLDLQGNSLEQKAAQRRLQEHQSKLPDLLKLAPVLPNNIITPLCLATDKEQKNICGYTMKFLDGAEVFAKYGEKNFRQSFGVPIENDIIEYFKQLHGLVQEIHKHKLIIGDFNDLNILIFDNQVNMIDTDSWQFNNYLCAMFTAQFVDPTLCNPDEQTPILVKPHNLYSDWYAYNVLLMQILLYVGPYGGIYLPTNKENKIKHNRRPLERISIFNDNVKYPKPAIPYEILPDDLLEYFRLVFEKDKREEFPFDYLDNLRWTTCNNCGEQHAKNICPFCAVGMPTKIIQRIHGDVSIESIFKTNGQILFARFQDSSLHWLYWQDDKLYRENGNQVNTLRSAQNMKFRLQKDSTFIGLKTGLIKVDNNNQLNKWDIDTYHNIPMFDANSMHFYWVEGGKLYRDDILAPKYIGDVCENQTLFWVGPKFGFGFYRAGNLQQGFMFDAIDVGIKDTIKLPKINGQLLDSTCEFSNSHCWFFTTTQEGDKRINRCYIFDRNGNLLGDDSADFGSASWLGKIKGNVAVSNILFSPTDDGITRISLNSTGGLDIKIFEDTEPFVSTENYLQLATNGLHVISDTEIFLLKMN